MFLNWTHLIKGSLILVLLLVFGCSKQEDISLVKRGKTTYSIYVDPSAPESVRNAAEDLKSYFIKVTGASPELIVTTQLPSSPFISLGNTTAAKDAGIYASNIPNDGFRILTKGRNLFIYGTDTPTGEVNDLGGVSNGTSNGVCTFIEDFLGVEWLMPGELGEEYLKVKSISIPAMDHTEFSPFNYRVVSFRSSGPLETEWDRHLKLGKVANVSHNHSWIETITPSYYDEHPDYFAQLGGKPIIPSGSYYKLETTNSKLVQAFADVIIETFRKNPDKRWYSLSPSDGGGWSDSPASRALTEKDSEGNISFTPLVIKFYNDVAKIVGKEFPDRKLGGYIYGSYRYPPSAGLSKLEPNLSLMLVGLTHHWRLYRSGMKERNDHLMHAWGESAERDGFELYFYDYPISLMMPNAMITPPTPDHLNFIFSHMNKYGFKGAYIYGNPVWPVFGAGNYILAKLFWNPEQDAHELLNYYCTKAYGVEASSYIVKLYDLLDTAYNHFYNKHLRAGSSLTADHLKEIYAEHYPDLEEYYLKALATDKNTKQQLRLKMLGQVLSLMQWHLLDHGLLSPNYKTPLTYTIEEIDKLISFQHDDFQITRRGRMTPEEPFRVEKTPALLDAVAQKASLVPIHRNCRMIMHVETSGVVTIAARAFNGNNEFVRYTITDAESNQLYAGVMTEDREIQFEGEAGKNYFLDIPSRGAGMKLEVEGAIIAYKAYGNNLQLAGRYMDADLPLYFYVPWNIKSFNITLGTRGVIIDIISPDGRIIDQLINESRKIIPVNNCGSGFWKLNVKKAEKGDVINVVLDKLLTQWFIPDPANPLKVTSAQ